jgi:ABC-type multidrug transport system fused ATPase/permease subunit
LTRIIEICGGQILIDRISISDICLDQVRECITIIPQDPALFTGTIRYNMDPLNLSSDESILSLLEAAGLSYLQERSEVPYLKDILNIEISQNGENFSSGERSLICICRAILKRSKVVILDEATANIDVKTEQRI